MGWEHDFDHLFKLWNYERENLNQQHKPSAQIIDCGELIEVNGAYQPAE